MIKVVRGTKTFDNNYVGLKNINIEIKNQGLYLFHGSSGSGKTTLLNCLSGIDNFNISNETNTIPKGKVSVVFQDYQLIDHFTVYENALFILEINGNKNTNKIDDILKKLNLYEWKDHKSNELSGGQKQRVSIMRAFLSDKPILVADEPTGNLDIEQSLEIASILKEISKTRIVLVASHDLDVFENYVDEVFYLENGEVKTHNIKTLTIREEVIPNIQKNEKLSSKHIIKFATKNYRTQKSKALILIFTLFLSFILSLTALNIMSNSIYKIKEKRFKSEKIEQLELVAFDEGNPRMSISEIEISRLKEKYKWDNIIKFIEILPDKIPTRFDGAIQDFDIARIYLTNEINTQINNNSIKINEDEVFITNKVAEKIIYKNGLNSINELLNKEITINNYVLKITDIIDVENSYNNKLSKNEKDAIAQIQNAIYLNETTFIKMSNRTRRDRVRVSTNLNQQNTEIGISNLEESFHKDLFLGDYPNNNKEVVISYKDAITLANGRALEDIIGEELDVKFYQYIYRNNEPSYSESIKYTIKGILTDSFENIPWIFTDDSYNYLSYSFGLNNYKNANLNGIVINDYSSKLLKELYKTNIRDYSYSTLDINVTNEYIKSISVILAIIGLLLLIVSAMVILSYINNSISSKIQEIGLLRSLNIKLKQIVMIFIVEILIFIAIVFLISICSEFLAIYLFNRFLIQQQIISFSFIYYTYLAPIIAMGLLVVLSIIFSSIIIIKIRNKTAYQLIRQV